VKTIVRRIMVSLAAAGILLTAACSTGSGEDRTEPATPTLAATPSLGSFTVVTTPTPESTSAFGAGAGTAPTGPSSTSMTLRRDTPTTSAPALTSTQPDQPGPAGPAGPVVSTAVAPSSPALSGPASKVAAGPSTTRATPAEPTDPVSRLAVSSNPLTVKPTAAVATTPKIAPERNPKINPAAALLPGASPSTVAGAFAQAWFHLDTTGSGPAWPTLVAPYATPALAQKLPGYDRTAGLPAGISTATVTLIAQRDQPALTATSVPLVIQADVVTVSPAGRLQDERKAALLNVLMIKTKTGWRVDQILGQAS